LFIIQYFIIIVLSGIGETGTGWYYLKLKTGLLKYSNRQHCPRKLETCAGWLI
jgi:hypothetical protein